MIVDGESLGLEITTGLLGNSRTDSEFRSTGLSCANGGKEDGMKFAAPPVRAADETLALVGRCNGSGENIMCDHISLDLVREAFTAMRLLVAKG